MTKNEKAKISEVLNDIERIVKWDNKNLKVSQYYLLDSTFNTLKALLKEGKK